MGLGTVDQTRQERQTMEIPMEHPRLQRTTYNTAVTHEPCQPLNHALENF
jgi:hypothetical protein